MTITEVLIVGLPILLAVTFHEAAHGFMAYVSGDATAKRMGRLTLNPIKHIDVIGTLLIPIMLLIVKAPFLFGYAKPVPINPKQFWNYRINLILVAIAGPAANVLLALGSWAWLKFIYPDPDYLVKALVYSIQINLVLAVFNMLPLLPLDGGRILSAVLPAPFDRKYLKLERYGFFVLVALLLLPTFFSGFSPLSLFIDAGTDFLKKMLGIGS
jgi:Zn-dependent protease